MPRREQIALSVFGSWTVFGLYLDGWAHEHDKPETFFTPWHGVLYSGVTFGVIWFVIEGIRQKRAGAIVADPPGGRLTSIGLTLFIIGAVGDFVWHGIFGIEANLEALLSPTHLSLMTGGVLLLSAVLRAAWQSPDEFRTLGRPTVPELAPVVVSVLLTTAVVQFFAQYLSAFDNNAVGDRAAFFLRDDSVHELRQIWGISAILFTNLLLLTPTVLMLRRWPRPPAGTFTLLYTVLAVGIQGMEGFPRYQVILPAVVGGLVADALVRWWRGIRVLGAAVPFALWTTYFLVYQAQWGVGWAAELVTGSIFLAVLSGLLLSLLAFPMAGPPGAPPGSEPSSDAVRPAARTPEPDPELLAS